MKMTLYGFEHWMQHNNDSLFKDIVLPAGMDKSILVNNILRESGEFGVIYTDPDWMKEAITDWFKTWQTTFEAWWTSWKESYDPLHNYDRTEELAEVEIKHSKQTMEADSNNSAENSTSSGVSSNSRSEDLTSAYDESSYSPDKKQISGVNENSSVTGESEGNEHSESIQGSSDNANRSHNLRAYGNIGVTTTQELMKAEMDLRSNYNPYQLINNKFMLDFLIPVYA